MKNLLAQKIEFFSQLISCGQELYFWEFDPALQLVSTNCPDAELFRYCLALDGSEAFLREYLVQGSTKPLIISNPIGLGWIAAFETAAEQICRIYMIGPTFTSDVSHQALESRLRSRRYPQEMITPFLTRLQNLPIVPLTSWMQYGLMLHFCVTGEKLGISDFNYQAETSVQSGDSQGTLKPVKGNTWLAEQTAMQIIEEGRLDYQSEFNQLSMSADMTHPAGTETSLRDFKNSVISFITLSTRAAIRGGLNVETAYFIGNHYIKNVENATSLTDLIRLNNTMYDDFVQRVHKVRSDSHISDGIQHCVHYIDLHLGEKLSVKILAKETGYSEYYLAQKFKKEMHVNLVEYIKHRRIDRAKLLLRSSDQSIQEIAEFLGFCNSSYFAENFRDIVGCTPATYREGNWKA